MAKSMKATKFQFVDANSNLVVLEVETSRGYISICAEYANSCGQCLDDIKPATDTQRELVEFWQKYHLSECTAENVGMLEDLCSRLSGEEDERKAQEAANSEYDINNDDEDMLSAIMDEKICDRHDAICMVALMRELGMEFSELDEVDGSGSEYRAQGMDFYVDDSDALDMLARDRMKNDDDCYLECWIDAVKNKGERRGYDDWCDYVVDMDGWCSVLNTWDGRYSEDKCFDGWICVSRC